MIHKVKKATDALPIKNCIISVSNKNGLDIFVNDLCAIIPDISIYSTGGTFIYLQNNLRPEYAKLLNEISSYTGQTEMHGGLVKSLDYKIYLGLLSESDNPYHEKDLTAAGAVKIDMVVVNLYPFKATVTKQSTDIEDARGNIDIGGPCMLRAAAKNFLRVLSVCGPEDYSIIIEELQQKKGSISLKTRYASALKSFTHTSEYDTEISHYLGNISPDNVIEYYMKQ